MHFDWNRLQVLLSMTVHRKYHLIYPAYYIFKTLWRTKNLKLFELIITGLNLSFAMDVSIWTWSIFSRNFITSSRYRLSIAFLFASRELSNFPCILTETCFHSMKSKMAAQWCHSTLWVSLTSTPLRSIPTYYMGTKNYNFSFLAHRDSYGSLANRFQLGTSTIHGIIPETCNAIYQVLQPIVLKEPDATDLARIERGFWRRWDFPNCIGAIDGKHCMIQSPPNSGSL